MNLLDLLEIQRRERPEAIALGEPGAGALTYRGLFAEIEAMAESLVETGLRPGDRVALLSENRTELVVAYLAILRLGAIAVPINTSYRPREVAHVLTDAEPRLVVSDGRGADLVDDLDPSDRASVQHILILPEHPTSPLPPRSPDGRYGTRRGGGGAASGGIPRRSLFAAEGCPAPLPTDPSSKGQNPPAKPQPPPPRRPTGSDPALLVYTSGTTGASKGAVLTHDNLLATVTALLAAWAWRPSDILLLALPLFHVHGLVVGLFTALAAGARVELRRRFDAPSVARELSGHVEDGAARPTVFFGVPTLYVRLVDELRRLDDRSGVAGMRLFASGSAPLAPETFHAFRELAGHEILERYGMSEAGMILSNPYAGPRRPGTVGVPLPGVSVRIVEPETAAEVPEGGDGELLVRGSNVFAGYWRDQEKTAASFVTGAGGWRWFRTGDLARRDPQTGHVTLLGRRHELILRGGENVYPREVEEVLESHPGVREAAVAGRPHPEWGEVPVAWVVADGDPPDPDHLLAWCRERLASFKVPEEVRFVDALPRNALGKLQKHRLGDAPS